MDKKRILIVDDEPDLREILQYNLENAGYEADTAASAEEALERLTPQHALILLDVMLGGISGFRLAERLRGEMGSRIPIIFLTARNSEHDLLTGFSAGGDDYITKPFSLQEVLARIKAVLRRHGSDAAPRQLNLGRLRIDTGRKTAYVDEEEIRLSPKEFGILLKLAGQPGRVFSREEIMAEVWRGESYVLDRTVDVHIARIRRKLGSEAFRLVNRPGYGYSLSDSPA